MRVFSNGKRRLLDERRLAQTQASSERSFPLGVCLHGPYREGAWGGEEGARVLSMKSKSLCASYPLPVCGPRKSSYEGTVSAGGGLEWGIIRTFCKSFWRHCKHREEIGCNGAYSALTDGFQGLQQEMTERELAILGSISKLPIHNRKHSCSTFPASSYCPRTGCSMLNLGNVSSCSSAFSKRVIIPGCAAGGTQQFPLHFSWVPLSCVASKDVLWVLSTCRVLRTCMVKLVSRECRSRISFLTDKSWRRELKWRGEDAEHK